MPFESFVPSPILTLLEAPLKAAIEAGYARDVNPGVATKVGLLPFRNPVQAIVNIIKAIPVGIDDAIAEATGDPTNRPLGTDPVTSPFGVGGPELPDPPSTEDDAELVMSARIGDDSVEPTGSSMRTRPNRAGPPPRATKHRTRQRHATEEDAIEEEDVTEEDATEEDVTEEDATEETTTGAHTLGKLVTRWTRSARRRSGVQSSSARSDKPETSVSHTVRRRRNHHRRTGFQLRRCERGGGRLTFEIRRRSSAIR